MTASSAPAVPFADEHSVLLWQTCAFAEDLCDAAGTGRRLSSPYDRMLDFLHHRLLPYLAEEERRLTPQRLRDTHLARLVVRDHERLRSGVEAIGSSRNQDLVVLAATALADRLERHVRREQSWLCDPFGEGSQETPEAWALPLLLEEVVDVDALPERHRDDLVRQRLGWLRAGETARLRSGADLHAVWRRQHAYHGDTHSWVYELAGPVRWQVRVTRRDDGG